MLPENVMGQEVSGFLFHQETRNFFLFRFILRELYLRLSFFGKTYLMIV